ncbi:MAG TPA: septal ring lytic transglycosylase RlpA family protein [Pseudolabrys sp.]
MPARASSRKRQKQPHSWIAQCARAAATLLVALVMLPGMISDVEDHQSLPLSISAIPDPDPKVFILAITESESSTITGAADTSTEDGQLHSHSREACLLEATLALSLVELPSPPINLIPLLTMSSSGPEMLDNVVALLPSSSGADLISYAGRKRASDFGYAYRDLVKRAAISGLQRIQDEAAFTRATIMGAASTYNPFRGGKEEGGPQTASGELYDPLAWTAAIKTELRNRFRGVRYGRLYQPTFALVQSVDKQLIVKINDVGPLRPGRVLDLNERSMRHLDPFLAKGVIRDVRITPLPGEDWTPGPVGVAYAIDLHNHGWRTASAHANPFETASRPADPKPTSLDVPVVHIPDSFAEQALRAVTPSSGG